MAKPCERHENSSNPLLINSLANLLFGIFHFFLLCHLLRKFKKHKDISNDLKYPAIIYNVFGCLWSITFLSSFFRFYCIRTWYKSTHTKNNHEKIYNIKL